MSITNFPNGISSFGVPVFAGGDMPILGDVYVVDGTYGTDGSPKGNADKPLKTIQAAITMQADRTLGKGDVIYVMPGTYAESLVGDLVKVQIIGVGRAGVRPMARIHPVATAAFTGEMDSSGFANLEFFSPSAPTADCAAIIVETNADSMFNLQNSYIDNCFFSGGAVDTTYASCGIILGALAAANTTYEFAEYSRIRGNTFASIGGRTKELTIGISLGSPDTSQGGAEYKGMTGCDISYNHINVYKTGIEMNCGAVGATNTYITHNHIASAEEDNGTTEYGILFTSAAADQLCFITDNRIISAGTPISNASTIGYVLGNWIGTAGTLTHALPAIAAA